MTTNSDDRWRPGRWLAPGLVMVMVAATVAVARGDGDDRSKAGSAALEVVGATVGSGEPLRLAAEEEAAGTRGRGGMSWSLGGHEIVCEIAFQRLTDEARAMLFAIREHDPQPSETFYRSCGWPDSSRYEDHKATYEYHFMNVVVPDADELVMQRDCANYDCVQLAIVRYARYTAIEPGDSESLQIRRANALKFVGHFVGDLHQPVHVGYAHDRGANDVYVDFYDEQDQRLHAVWDFHIPNRMGLYDDPIATARRLAAEITDADAVVWESFDVVGWSRESYEIVKELVYEIPPDGRIGDEYFDRAAPIVERRFKQAGVRLAYLLNHAASGTLDFPPLFESR
jgi:hypothetical protein